MSRIIGFIMLFVFVSVARGQTAYSYRYWFDNNLATLQTGSTTGETAIEISISTLTKGAVHALHLQGLDAREKLSPVHTQYFFIAKDADTETATARYWYDNDETTVQTAPTINGLINLDISHLNIGTHSVHYQTFNAAGEASPVHTQYFFIAKDTDTETATARYWYDNDETTVKTAPTTNGLINLDISHLNIGTHAVHYQTFNAAGEVSPVHTQYFYMNELQLLTLSCKIWIDDDEENAQIFDLTEDDIELDAEGWSIGTHDLHVILLDPNGNWLAESSTTFEIPIPTETITLAKATGGTYCPSMDLDFSEITGLKAYIAVGFDPEAYVVWIMRVNHVPANEGIMIKGTPDTYQVPYGKTSFHYNNLFVGSHVKQTLPTTSDGYTNYVLKDGVFRPSDGTASVGANKAYLRVPTDWTTVSAPELRIEVADETTGIVNIKNNRQVIDRYYNLNGQRIENPKKGIYIKGGKKIFIH